MLLRQVEQFLRRHEMPATKFGRLAAHDPRFVLDLRMGREPRAATEARTLRWMAQYEAAHSPALEAKGYAHA
jgi:2,4-dienoyl-CoA reductase-like NADH-dependent reductase (Old Yellow Enzyme family)